MNGSPMRALVLAMIPLVSPGVVIAQMDAGHPDDIVAPPMIYSPYVERTQRNRDFAEGQTETYARMFREILAVDNARFLVHCAAGKDRTGFAAAIILLALGVPREAVMRDYMLTARYFNPLSEIDRLRKKYQMDNMDASAIMPMLEVHEAYLARALQVIEENFDSVEAYLEGALGLGPAELAELRGRYLE